MRISFDQSKRDRTFADRGLAFEDAALVFKGVTVEVEDTRKQYGERRVIATAYYMTGWWSLGTPSEVRRVTFSACERPTIVKKRASAPTSKSDLAKSDAHAIRPHEYRDLPDLTDQALARAVVNRGGRPRSANPRKLISIRLPVDVIERWKATGPGWQTRIADRLSKRR